MAISTYQTFLMTGTAAADGGAVTMDKLVDITSFPDLGGAPETIDVTTLSDSMRVFIKGIQQNDIMSFEANYDLAKYKEIKQLSTQKDIPFGVWFGADASGKPNGNYGKFEFKGEVDVYTNGGAVNEGVKMTISIAPSSKIAIVE